MGTDRDDSILAVSAKSAFFLDKYGCLSETFLD